jgi:hypothetical protein
VRLTYSEFQQYSPLEDEQVIRLSVVYNGREFFALLTAEPRWRDRRNRALDCLAMIVADGGEPGDYTADVRTELGERQLEGVCDGEAAG